MNADNSDSKVTAAGAAAGVGAEDPFAVDLFGPSSSAATASNAGSPDRRDAASPAGGYAHLVAATPSRGVDGPLAYTTAWAAHVPRVSRREAQLSESLGALPPGLSRGALDACARVLARLTSLAPQEISLEAAGVREVGEGARRGGDASGLVSALLAVEPDGAALRVEFGRSFASSLAGLMLGDAGAPEELRPLSEIEHALVEFLFLSLVRELNEAAGESLLRLVSVADGGDAAPATAGDTDERLYEVTARVRLGAANRTTGVVRLLLGAPAVNALDARRNPLLASPKRAGGLIETYQRFAQSAPLCLIVGETPVEVATLATLEAGDVLLVEQQYGTWGAGAFPGGGVRLRAGAPPGVVVEGRAESSPVSGELRVEAERVYADPARRADSWRAGHMSERDDELAGGAASAADAGVLDSLLLTVHVELPARRVTLEELARLRPGQILELNCRATDPVELVADGRRIASGELVEVEGQLGVRVTRVVA